MLKNLAISVTVLLFSTQLVFANPANDPTTLWNEQRHIGEHVDHDTWCGDCIDVDYTTGEPWVINPGWLPGYTPPIILPENPSGSTEHDDGCSWDLDDFFEYTSQGGIFGPGASLSLTECLWYTHAFRYGWTGATHNALVWRSTSPDLVITYKWEWDAGVKTYTVAPPIKSGTTWEYRTCLVAPPPVGGTKIDVPNSHGGQAIWVLQTITITNPTNKKASKTGGFITTDYRGIGAYCPYGTFIEI